VSIAQICRRLDGLPLALELAAARIRVLPPDALLGLLGHGLALLTGGPRDLPERQQTIRATIAWSHELLNPAERRLFRRLSVFASDFSLDAAMAIGSTDPGHPTLDLLASLVEKNLLRQTPDGKELPRFRMLETVREFGQERLEVSGEADDVYRAHADFFVAMVEDAAPHLRSAEREGWMERIDAEMHNLRSVVDWSTSGGSGGGEALIRIVLALGFLYWRIRGHLAEGMRWSELALTYCTTEHDALFKHRVTLLWQAGGLAGYMGALAPARAWLEESVRLARESGGTDLGHALVLLGFVESHFSEPAAATTYLTEGLAVLRTRGDSADLAFALAVAILPYALVGESTASRVALSECLSVAGELGDDWLCGVALNSAGFLDIRERNWAAARLHMQEALAIFRRHGDEGSMAHIYNNLGVAAREQGDHAGSLEFLEQSLRMTRRLGVDDAITLSHLGDHALRRGDTARAALHIEDALRSASRSGDTRAIMSSLCRSARLAAAVAQPAMAARLLGALFAMRQQVGPAVAPELAPEMEHVADLARSALGEPSFRTAVTEGEATEGSRLTAETVIWVHTLRSTSTDAGPDATPSPTNSGLSAREIEVLRLIAGGRSNREIADALAISLNTVARHISNIFDKLGAANRTEAAAYAHRHGLAGLVH
jgi:DNA-binding CsgD family transcriptional regulator/tetratricopeptide (TPR) repeat protein